MKMSKNYSRVILMIGLAAGLGLGTAVTAQVKLPAPVIVQPTEPPNVIDYPTCPNGFSLAQKGAYIFTCKVTAPQAFANVYILLAESLNCGVSDHWTQGPIISTQNAGNQVTVRTKCLSD